MLFATVDVHLNTAKTKEKKQKCAGQTPQITQWSEISPGQGEVSHNQ